MANRARDEVGRVVVGVVTVSSQRISAVYGHRRGGGGRDGLALEAAAGCRVRRGGIAFGRGRRTVADLVDGLVVVDSLASSRVLHIHMCDGLASPMPNERQRPRNVPSEAFFDEADGAWALGEKNARHNRKIGVWNDWREDGTRACDEDCGDGTTRSTYRRFCDRHVESKLSIASLRAPSSPRIMATRTPRGGQEPWIPPRELPALWSPKKRQNPREHQLRMGGFVVGRALVGKQMSPTCITE